MIYNYTPGVTEILSLQPIGQNDGTNTVIKVDGYFTNISSDLTLYTDAAGTSQVPIDAYAQTSIDQTVTNLEVGKTNKTAYKTYIVTNPTYQNIDLWATFTNFGTYTDNQAVVDLTLEKEKTKVLWTGPLSVAGVPTSLDAGENFSDWDSILFQCNLRSDTGITNVSSEYVPNFGSVAISTHSSSGFIEIVRVADTSFQITGKTVPLGNISRIIGIKL